MKVEVAAERPENAHYVWAEGVAPSRNQYVRFSLEVDWSPAARDGGENFPLHVFADTRYRLTLNGDFVAAGPGRFVTAHPEFDTHDLLPLLRAGKNRIVVEVNFFGASSFQSMPDGKPGFIAWGGNAFHDLATPGTWRAEVCAARKSDSPLFSFAQNPLEICDTRLLESGRPVGCRVLDGKESPWLTLTPYSARRIGFEPCVPETIEVAGALDNRERLFGFLCNIPEPSDRLAPRPWTAFATWVHSPTRQVVRISCFWSEISVNGTAVKVELDTPFGNHGYCTVDLLKGWNLVVGSLEVLVERWTWLLGIPEGTGLTLHSRRDKACRTVFAVAPSGPRNALYLPQPSDHQEPPGWAEKDGDTTGLTPARIVGWDEIAASAVRDLPFSRLPEVSGIEAAEATWCFSFAGEYLGYVSAEVEAPAGSILDIAYDDWQTPSGGVAIYRSNPFTDAADRFILRGGRQRIEVFHLRGGKFLQCTLRTPGKVTAPLALHSVFVRSRQTLKPGPTDFSCDDETLDWAWSASLRTLRSSVDESFSDCPWRERGTYVGDARVNAQIEALLDTRLPTTRRVLKLFSQAALPDGLIPSCAPSWLTVAHPDFSFLWVLLLRDYWETTGDTDFVGEVWPTVEGLFASPRWVWNGIGLLDATPHLFIDWGVLKTEREGNSHATLNLFGIGALRAASDLARSIGRDERSAAFLEKAAAMEEALLEHLWDDQKNRLLPSIGHHTPALHANVLALYFKIGSAERRKKILAYLEPHLRANFRKGLTTGLHGGYLELYFLSFLLPALAEHDRPDLGERIILDHYGYLQTLGDDTLPECFARVENQSGSRCHSWSGAAAIYAARYVLGIRSAGPSGSGEWMCQPVVHGITRARGRIAHPAGWLEVEWERVGPRIHLHSFVVGGEGPARTQEIATSGQQVR